MASYREIVTKAVIGKVKKTNTNSFVIETDETPNTVLGCWVINNSFSGVNNNGNVLVNGSFDVNVWYSYDNDTKTTVCTRKMNYTEKLNVPVNKNDIIDNESDIIVKSLRQPTVTNVGINGNNINLDIEKEIGVEIVGNTKVRVSVDNLFDDYEEVIDENEIDNIKEEYLEEK